MKKVICALFLIMAGTACGPVPNPSSNQFADPLTDFMLGTYLVSSIFSGNLVCGNTAGTAGQSHSISSGTITIDGSGPDWNGSSGYLLGETLSDAGGTGTDIMVVKMVKDSSNLYVELLTGNISSGNATATGSFTITLRPVGGTGTNDDTIKLIGPADTCGGGVTSATIAGAGLEAKIPFGCLANAGVARAASRVTVVSGNDTASCVTQINW